MLEVLDMDPSRFDLSTTSFAITRLTSDRPREIRSGLDLSTTGFVIGLAVAFLTSNKSYRRSLAFDNPRGGLAKPLTGLFVASWPSTAPHLTSATTFFIFVFAGEALTALALAITFFNGEGPRCLWRVLDLTASGISGVCYGSALCGVYVLCSGVPVLFIGLLHGSFSVWPCFLARVLALLMVGQFAPTVEMLPYKRAGFKFHPEFRRKSSKCKGNRPPCTSTVVDTSPVSIGVPATTATLGFYCLSF
ncbi:hypothetical protein Acr_00g0070070 [Actinidia rufa]|uniref:Uncharacterized protein n=1 Tax=Actinidia rufa TaxID=165716 RepID=A0A7J0DRE7_9ERIC|nr:hypothetical protein Acr_00g0070070 [Actinidia rufa]